MMGENTHNRMFEKQAKVGEFILTKKWKLYAESRQHFNDLPTGEIETEGDEVVGQIVDEGSESGSQVM
jgi:hypothetical protein